MNLIIAPPVWDVTIETKEKKKMKVLRFNLFGSTKEITRFCLPDVLDSETKQFSSVDSAAQTVFIQISGYSSLYIDRKAKWKFQIHHN